MPTGTTPSADMNDEDLFSLPTQKELDDERPISVPLAADEYICKIVRIDLVQGKKFKSQETQLQYKLLLLPYCLKDGGSMVDMNGKEMPPLTKWLTRYLNPFAIGFVQATKSPTLCRSFIYYMNGETPSPNKAIKLKKILVVKNQQAANEAESLEYRKQFREVQNNERKPENFEMRQKGFTHIPDLSIFAGQYVGATVTIDEKEGKSFNKVVSFSKLPKDFVPDASVEQAAMNKFEETWERIQTKGKSAPAKKADSVEVSDDSDIVEVPDASF